MPELSTPHPGSFKPGNKAAVGHGRPRARRLTVPHADNIDLGYGLDGGAVLQRLGRLAGVPQLTDDELAAARRVAAGAVETFTDALCIVLSELCRLQLELNRRDPRSVGIANMARRLGRAFAWEINRAVATGAGHSLRCITMHRGLDSSVAEALMLVFSPPDDIDRLIDDAVNADAADAALEAAERGSAGPDDAGPLEISPELLARLIRSGAIERVATAATTDTEES